MLFSDQYGLVFPVEELLSVETCTEMDTEKSCIRYVFQAGQGCTVRGYPSEAVRDEVFQGCVGMFMQYTQGKDAWDQWHHEMIKKGVMQSISRGEQEERGW
jgi:hypothetical protein